MTSVKSIGFTTFAVVFLALFLCSGFSNGDPIRESESATMEQIDQGPAAVTGGKPLENLGNTLNGMMVGLFGEDGGMGTAVSSAMKFFNIHMQKLRSIGSEIGGGIRGFRNLSAERAYPTKYKAPVEYSVDWDAASADSSDWDAASADSSDWDAASADSSDWDAASVDSSDWVAASADSRGEPAPPGDWVAASAASRGEPAPPGDWVAASAASRDEPAPPGDLDGEILSSDYSGDKDFAKFLPSPAIRS